MLKRIISRIHRLSPLDFYVYCCGVLALRRDHIVSIFLGFGYAIIARGSKAYLSIYLSIKKIENCLDYVHVFEVFSVMLAEVEAEAELKISAWPEIWPRPRPK